MQVAAEIDQKNDPQANSEKLPGEAPKDLETSVNPPSENVAKVEAEQPKQAEISTKSQDTTSAHETPKKTLSKNKSEKQDARKTNEKSPIIETETTDPRKRVTRSMTGSLQKPKLTSLKLSDTESDGEEESEAEISHQTES